MKTTTGRSCARSVNLSFWRLGWLCLRFVAAFCSVSFVFLGDFRLKLGLQDGPWDADPCCTCLGTSRGRGVLVFFFSLSSFLKCFTLSNYEFENLDRVRRLFVWHRVTVTDFVVSHSTNVSRLQSSRPLRKVLPTTPFLSPKCEARPIRSADWPNDVDSPCLWRSQLSSGRPSASVGCALVAMAQALDGGNRIPPWAPSRVQVLAPAPQSLCVGMSR